MRGWEAALYLEQGHLFTGLGFGAAAFKGGEIVFNTGMTGYQEIFTDPSYCRQIVVMGYPHIGNTGINFEDFESGVPGFRGLSLSGIVVREYCALPSSWRSQLGLSEYLAEYGVPGIYDVDTRAITRALRDEGAQRAVLFPVADAKGGDLTAHANTLLAAVPPMEGQGLVSEVSCRSPYDFAPETGPSASRTVVVYDYGVKRGILDKIRQRGFHVRVVPFQFPYPDVLAMNPAAVVLSNGPGDPAEVPGAVEAIQGIVGKAPILAICMGHQLLARSLGGQTYKLKFGHHGVNHPVQDRLTKRILITSQNHGFAVKAEDLKREDVVLSHVNLNDGTVEGFSSEKMRFSSVQFHPEANPGPSDAAYIFENFIKGFVQ